MHEIMHALGFNQTTFIQLNNTYGVIYKEIKPSKDPFKPIPNVLKNTFNFGYEIYLTNEFFKNP